MSLMTARSSTIFISAGRDTKVYHSVAEVPPRLRRRLEETTHSQNSVTILIADKRGREELVRALQGEPSPVQCRLADTIRLRNNARNSPAPDRMISRTFRRWLEFLIPLAIGGGLWALIESRF